LHRFARLDTKGIDASRENIDVFDTRSGEIPIDPLARQLLAKPEFPWCLKFVLPMDLSAKVRQTVKTHFSSNGELSHGSNTTEVHEGV